MGFFANYITGADYQDSQETVQEERIPLSGVTSLCFVVKVLFNSKSLRAVQGEGVGCGVLPCGLSTVTVSSQLRFADYQ